MRHTKITETIQALPASKLIGHEVRNHEGDYLGEIEDLVIDMESGDVAYAVLSFGGSSGVIGFTDKWIAVPMQLLQLGSMDGTIYLNIDKDDLENAPGFKKGNWPNTLTTEWVEDVHVYYGVRPYWD
jgi:sporulation protein YlmC with PRC-barrel domain